MRSYNLFTIAAALANVPLASNSAALRPTYYDEYAFIPPLPSAQGWKRKANYPVCRTRPPKGKRGR